MQREYFIKVYAGENNNKFYEMEELPGGQEFQISHGRIGTRGRKKIYPLWRWDEIYRRRLKNGYTRQTDLHRVAEGSALKPEIDSQVQALLSQLNACSRQYVQDNFIVDVNAVTQGQIATARQMLREFESMAFRGDSLWAVNGQLEGLWMVIPRKMKKVKAYLLSSLEPQDITAKVDEENDILAAMETQIAVSVDGPGETLSQRLGLTMHPLGLDPIPGVPGFLLWPEIKDWQGHTLGQVKQVYEVKHKSSRVALREHLVTVPKERQVCDLLLHGSRNENWFSVLNTGLVVHSTANARTTGTAFGDGIYFANKPAKSLGYCDGGFWTGGDARNRVMGVFYVHTGKYYNLTRSHWDFRLPSGYDSTFYRGGSGGYFNDEQIVYNPAQCTLRYLLEIGG